jgi:hypothetical protein
MVFIPATSRSEDRSWPKGVDVAKALFMAEIAHIVAEGLGEIARLESGTVELRLVTGQIFHLGEQSVTRIA